MSCRITAIGTLRCEDGGGGVEAIREDEGARGRGFQLQILAAQVELRVPL